MAKHENFDLDALTVPELTALIEAAEAARDGRMAGARAALRAEMVEKAAALGLSPEALLKAGTSPPTPAPGGRKVRRDAGQPVPAKYRGPNGEEWSGRGRPPNWLAALEAEGQGRERYRL